MKIFVIAKPQAKMEKVEKIDENHFKVWTKERPVRGKANKAIRKLLANFLGISPAVISLIAGQKGKRKIFRRQEVKRGKVKI